MITYVGSLAQLCCGEGEKLQTNATGMCRECLKFMDHTQMAIAQGIMHLRVQAPQAPGYAKRAQSQVGYASPQGGWSQSMTLRVDMNCQKSQEDVVSNWRPAHRLVGHAVSKAEFAAAPCLPPLAVARLPLYLQGGP